VKWNFTGEDDLRCGVAATFRKPFGCAGDERVLEERYLCLRAFCDGKDKK